MSDGIVPAIEFDDAAIDGATASGRAPVNGLASSSVLRKRRTLDLRRTETPGLGDMPRGPKKHRHRRRYAVVMQLFSQLGWMPGTRVDIRVGEGHEIVVRRDEDGAWALTTRNMVLTPAPLRRWCGYDAGDPVLVVAVPSMSAVVLHSLETLGQALPDPRRIVHRMRPPAAPAGVAVAAENGGDGELVAGSGSHHGNGAQGAKGSNDGRG